MIINSKKKSLNCVLLRKGGDKLFIHSYFPKPKLPLISINYQKNINTLNHSPLFSEKNFFSVDNNKNLNINSNNNKYKKINNTLKISTIHNETPKNEQSSFDFDPNNNSIQSIINKKTKTKNTGTSINSDDFLSYEKTLNNFNNKKSIVNNKTFIYVNSNNITLNNNFDNNKNDLSLNHNYQNFRIDDSISDSKKSSIELTLNNKKDFKKDLKIKENLKKLNNKKKFVFIQKFLKNNRNFLIDDYLKYNFLLKKNKFLSNNKDNKDSRCNFLTNKNENNKKEGQPILIKDIRIKSLLNDYENKKKTLLKLSPFIIRNNYLNKNNMNTISGIKDYEIKINLNKKSKYNIKLGNIGNIFDLSKRK